MTAFLGLSLSGCSPKVEDSGEVRGWAAHLSAFDRELQELRAALQIPGLAYVIVSGDERLASRAFGSVQGSSAQAFSISTPLRIASVTKSLAAIVILQLAQEGLLDLEAPARRYVPELELPDEVLVRHLLSHTSEGEIGEEFVYGTTRYAMLGRIIEAVTDAGLEQVLRARVQEPAGMATYPSPALGAHAGLVSTTDDMGAFLEALGRGTLLAPEALGRLTEPVRSGSGRALPMGLGWFTQSIQGQRVLWSFGQDDPEHSGALLLHLPERRLSLFILANSNVLSDPFRLLMGDVSKSPFAMSFLRLFVFSEQGEPLTRPPLADPGLMAAVEEQESRFPYRYRDEWVGWGLIDLWHERGAAAQSKFHLFFSRYDDADPPDAVVHFAALRLPADPDKDRAIAIGEELLSRHPGNRWNLLAQGYLLQQRQRGEASAACFRRILELPNQQDDFLHRLFKAWSWMALAELAVEEDPALARSYLRRILELPLPRGMLEDAESKLASLEEAANPGAP